MWSTKKYIKINCKVCEKKIVKLPKILTLSGDWSDQLVQEVIMKDFSQKCIPKDAVYKNVVVIGEFQYF